RRRRGRARRALGGWRAGRWWVRRQWVGGRSAGLRWAWRRWAGLRWAWLQWAWLQWAWLQWAWLQRVRRREPACSALAQEFAAPMRPRPASIACRPRESRPRCVQSLFFLPDTEA